MKFLMVVALALYASPGFGFDENSYVMKDGKLFFKPYKITVTTAGGGPYFAATIEEKEKIEDNLRGRHWFSISTVTESTFDHSVSTTVAFDGFDDFKQSFSSKAHIAEKAVSLGERLASIEELKRLYPSLAVLLNNKARKIKTELDALVEVFKSLP